MKRLILLHFRRFAYLFFFVQFFCSCDGKTRYPDKSLFTWNIPHLKGKVRSFVEIKYNTILNDTVLSEKRLSSIDSVFYHENGNFDYEAKTWFFPSSSYPSYILYSYTYNANGDILTSGERRMRGFDTSMSKAVCLYNKAGKIVEEDITTEFERDKNLNNNCKKIFSYDGKGNKIVRYYDSKLYDSLGNEVKIDVTKQNPSRLFTYDDSGNLTLTIDFKKDGTIADKDTFIYDGKGNNVEHYTLFSDKGVYARYTKKYDDRNNEIENNKYREKNSLNGKDTIFDRAVIRYDNSGNIIERKEYGYGGHLTYEIYKYDDCDNNGNYLKIKYSSSTDSQQLDESVITRKIEYYK